jgi:hypothetical protein
MVDLNRQTLPAFVLLEFLFELIFPAYQNYTDLVMLGGLYGAFDFRLGSVVPSHGVKGDGCHFAVWNALRFSYFDHFAVLVFATEHAGAVRQNRLMARRTLGDALYLQMVMRTAAGSAALRMAPFRVWHGESLSFSFRLLGKSFKSVPTVVDRRRLAIARCGVAILPAVRAHTLAIRLAHPLHGQVQ